MRSFKIVNILHWRTKVVKVSVAQTNTTLLFFALSTDILPTINAFFTNILFTVHT